jgi:multidrug efflux pump subunit AcrA (membrane-fusion protein)
MATLPSIPSLRPLVILNVTLGAVAGIGLFLPINLAVTLQGVMVSSGPTISIVVPTDAIVTDIPSEDLSYSQGSLLFRFRQPLTQTDLESNKRELEDLRTRLAEANKACKGSIADSERRLTEAQLMDRLNTNAYTEQAISRLQLSQFRSSLYNATRDLDDIKSRCRQEQSQLRSDIRASQDQYEYSLASERFQNILSAPSEGNVYAITVKSGQRVKAGQEIARFISSRSSIAELRLISTERPFVQLGTVFDVTSPTYAFMPTPPTRICQTKTITPDLISNANSISSDQSSVYVLRCQFIQPASEGSAPFLIGMDLVARTAGVTTSLFQLLLKGYRSTLMTAS